MNSVSASRASGVLEDGGGVLRLAPTWVPRRFCVPGRRLKLHPDDLFALGAERGGIDERWLASTIVADNGPQTGAEEGLSVVMDRSGKHVGTLAEVVAELGASLLGEEFWVAHGSWPMFATIFDNQHPLPFHVHPAPKSEAYFFPPQLNGPGGAFPVSYLGLRPDISKDELRSRLAAFDSGDNRITELAPAYRLNPGVGWDIPAGVLHAPGTLCTYEPQHASDAFAMCESVNNGLALSSEALWKDVPPTARGDVDRILEMVDWEANVDPEFVRNRFMRPLQVSAEADSGCEMRWVAYRSAEFSAKEVTVMPGREVTVRDAGAYGLVVVQGHGTFGRFEVESPALIRYGQLTNDELFVAASSAVEGIVVSNPSDRDPLVFLQHFGPGNPDVPAPPR
jgi:hypothetical protein